MIWRSPTLFAVLLAAGGAGAGEALEDLDAPEEGEELLIELEERDLALASRAHRARSEALAVGRTTLWPRLSVVIGVAPRALRGLGRQAGRGDRLEAGARTGLAWMIVATWGPPP